MDSFQKDKLRNTIRLSRMLLNLLLEMKEYTRKNLKEHKTLMCQELFENLAHDNDEPLWVIRRKHENGKAVYEAKPMAQLLAELIVDAQAELLLLGEKEDKDAA